MIALIWDALRNTLWTAGADGFLRMFSADPLAGEQGGEASVAYSIRHAPSSDAIILETMLDS